jgi:hypothetical protein
MMKDFLCDNKALQRHMLKFINHKNDRGVTQYNPI